MTSPRKPPHVKNVFSLNTFNNPSIFGDEDPTQYTDFMRQVHDTWQPQNAVETTLVDDVVHYQWQAMRERRLRLKHIAACQPEGLAAVLETLPMEDEERQDLVDGFAAGDADVVARVIEVLASAGHDLETVQARTLALRSADVAGFDARIAAFEKRRDKSARDLEDRRYRAELEQRRREKHAADQRKTDE